MKLIFRMLILSIVGVSVACANSAITSESSLQNNESEDILRFTYEFEYEHTEENKLISTYYATPAFRADADLFMYYRNVIQSKIRQTDSQTGIRTRVPTSGPEYVDAAIKIAKRHWWSGRNLDDMLVALKKALRDEVKLLDEGLARISASIEPYEKEKRFVREEFKAGRIGQGEMEVRIGVADTHIGNFSARADVIASRQNKVRSIHDASGLSHIDLDW